MIDSGCHCTVRALSLLVLATGLTAAQSPTPAAQSPSGTTPQESATNVPEVTTHEKLETFQVKVNPLEVPVMVRDAQGNAVGNLKPEDFLLFDDKKPRTITKFTVEPRASPNAPALPKQAAPTQAAGDDTVSFVCKHRTAYVFDDVGATSRDLIRPRNAVASRIAKMPTDEHDGIFTISGQGDQDFTNDHGKLQAALLNLKSRPVKGFTALQCPPIDYYTATQIARNYYAQARRMVMPDPACRYDGNDRVAIFLEVYEPQIANATPPKVSLKLRILDQITGQSRLEARVPDTGSSLIPGNRVIPLGVPLPVDHLQPGSYMVELRASDSAGQSSVARRAEFTVE